MAKKVERQRPYSIRTRIKTIIPNVSVESSGQRPYSIRTRIKTYVDQSGIDKTFLSETIFH